MPRPASTAASAAWTSPALASALLLTAAVLLVLHPSPATAHPISPGDGKFLLANMVEPPRRPEQFRNLNELNDYLSELRQYYTIIGRPRFGRSVDRMLERTKQH